MSEGYLGEIRLFGGIFAPVKWTLCYGQLEAVSSNEALFSLLGTAYGGDGRSSFGIPDMRGRVPVHQGTGPGLTHRQMGQRYGTETETLTEAQMPHHTHAWAATNNPAGDTSPNGNVLAAQAAPGVMYELQTEVTQPFAAPQEVVEDSGGDQAHINLMPTLALNFIMCTAGTYPSRN